MSSLAPKPSCGLASEQVPEISDAWTVYSDFLCEKNRGEIPRWYAPLEIDAELFGRKVTRNFHPDEELLRFQERYQNYERVLRFESSGEFNLEDFLEKLIVIEKIDEGLKDVKAGNTVDHTSVKKMVKKWRK